MKPIKTITFLLAVIISLSFITGCTSEKPRSIQSNINSEVTSSQIVQTDPVTSNPGVNNIPSKCSQQEISSNISSIEDSSDITTSKHISSQTTQNESSDNSIMIKNNCRLVIKDKDITDSTYVMLVENPDYIPDRGRPMYRPALPVVAIMRALGAKVQWNSNIVATIIYNGEKYILDISKRSLVVDGEELLLVAPGGKIVIQHQVLDHELIVDQVLLLRFFQLNNIKIRIDNENKIINIY